jgi:hypothetical protein
MRGEDKRRGKEKKKSGSIAEGSRTFQKLKR